jgi:hypothetical protein
VELTRKRKANARVPAADGFMRCQVVSSDGLACEWKKAIKDPNADNWEQPLRVHACKCSGTPEYPRNKNYTRYDCHRNYENGDVEKVFEFLIDPHTKKAYCAKMLPDNRVSLAHL